MKKYGNTRIRDLIHMHPRVLDILKEFEFYSQSCYLSTQFLKCCSSWLYEYLREVSRQVTSHSLLLKWNE